MTAPRNTLVLTADLYDQACAAPHGTMLIGRHVSAGARVVMIATRFGDDADHDEDCDPATFGALMGEYQDAVNNQGTEAAQAVARKWGFDPHQFSDMRSYMRRKYPGMRESAGGAPTFGGGAPVGDEPCTWDQYCEIHGAMAAWMQNGADVDVNLRRYFNVTRDDLNRFGLHWSSGDMGRFQEQVNKSAVHTARYLQMPM